MDKFIKVVQAELEPLMRGKIFGTELKGADADALSAIFAVLQFLEDEVKTRKEEIRQDLLALAEADGKPTDKGGQTLKTKYGTATRERREGKLPQEEPIKDLLAEHQVPYEDAFSEQKKMVLDPSKVMSLVDRGKLSMDEVKAARKVTWALKFKPRAATTEALEETCEWVGTE